MKKVPIFIFIIAVFISACKKDKQDTNVVPLVKTINDGTDLDTIKYNAQNKIIEYNVWGGHAYTFSYFNNDSVVSFFDNRRYAVCTFNTFNQHIKTVDYYNGQEFGEFKYTYDGDGKIIYRIYYNLSGAGAVNYERDSLYYSANNCSSFVNILKLGAGAGGLFVDRYTKVFLNKKNTLGLKNFGLVFYDDFDITTTKYDEFIRSTFFDEQLVSEFYYEDGTIAMKFEYEFDSQDRVIKRVRKQTGVADYVERFTYY